MENEKYFTPSIEDIRVGYECERKKDGIWSTNIFDTNYNPDEIDIIINDLIRVPYLTKEQIEAELKGWKMDGKNWDGGAWDKKVNNKLEYRIDYDFDKKELIIWHSGEEYLDVLYQGECKDINTFRYLSKLLKI